MIKQLRIVTLSENSVAAGGYQAEWGLSMLVETEEGNILLDTGAGPSIVQNAARLQINLSDIDKLVLSHSHPDHTGGLRDFLRQRNREIEVIAHPDIFASKYGSLRKDGPLSFVGIPFNREGLESAGARFKLIGEPVHVTDNIMTTGLVPMVTDFEKVMERASIKKGSEMLPDDIPDDQSLVIKTDYGLVVMFGCGHRGVINHLLHAQKITGIKEINLVVGGCHLFNAPEEQVEKTVKAFKELDVKRLGVSHCTGMKAAFAMMQAFGDRFFFNNSGTVVKVPPDAGRTGG